MSAAPSAEPPERTRLDKWLWAARFYKTRALATTAVEGGKVHLNGARTKPAKEIRIGDTLDIAIADMRWTVVVRALAIQRRPAPEAHQLYEEAVESLARRQLAMEARRLKAAPGPTARSRPTKRDRRRLARLDNDAF